MSSFFEGKYEKVGIVWFEISISTSRSKRQGQWQGRFVKIKFDGFLYYYLANNYKA